ncbi:putative atp synthase 24 kda subunit [Quercus suber]|uniref:Atp synthase 24 kDa subunit n=1 Tax=Quercus suber TaxID=58331 RepID=A0AAW0KG22_QUESU
MIGVDSQRRRFELLLLVRAVLVDGRGLTDELGAEAMMFDALEKVEKELKKPLMRNDKNKNGCSYGLLRPTGVDLVDDLSELWAIRQTGCTWNSKGRLPKYEEQLELKIAKAQLEELKKDTLEAMETQRSVKNKFISVWADLFSESQRIQFTIQSRTQDIPDARSYLLTLKEIRIKRGLTDELGAEAMMFDALEKVEKELKKPLMRNDKKGMAVLMAEFDKINKKLGIRKEDLPKYEEQLELKIAKAQLEELKKDTLEAMETQKKRYVDAC